MSRFLSPFLQEAGMSKMKKSPQTDLPLACDQALGSASPREAMRQSRPCRKMAALWGRREALCSQLETDGPELRPRLHLVETSLVNLNSPSLSFLLYKMQIAHPSHKDPVNNKENQTGSKLITYLIFQKG